jgi:hypothetical protein
LAYIIDVIKNGGNFMTVKDKRIAKGKKVNYFVPQFDDKDVKSGVKSFEKLSKMVREDNKKNGGSLTESYNQLKYGF